MSSDIQPIEVEEMSPVRRLVDQVEEIRANIEALAEAGDWEGLVRGIVPLSQMMRELRELETFAKQKTAESLPAKLVTVEGVGTVERRAATTRRKWDSEELLRKIIVHAMVDTDTGELRTSSSIEAADIVMREVLAVLPVTPSTGWRVTALKARGFDPDEWCETNHGPATVQITASKQEGK